MSNQELLHNKKSVPFEFNKVAEKYDLATFLSQGYQKDLFLSVKRMNLKGNEYLADLCCGTGKSTYACTKFLGNGKILAIDNSAEMLKIARSRFANNNVKFVQEDIMGLDYPENTFDAIFMAYGIRNMPDYNDCLLILKKILKPGAVICFHEYSLKKNVFSKLYWKIMGYLFIIPISTLLSGTSRIYKYLVKSVLAFPSPNTFQNILKSNGFENVQRLSMPSWRKPILHTFLAYNPK